MNTPPLSPSFEHGLARLREFLAPYPLLRERISSARLDDGRICGYWPAYPFCSYAERQAACLQAREAGKWHQERVAGSYNYVLHGDGVEITVGMAAPIPPEKESREIDWTAIGPKE